MDEQAVLGRDGFADLINVSRETLERLEAYVALLTKWQATLNLVAPSTLADVWRRHILDSAQVFALIDRPAEPLVDIGSGAGFPGLVLGIMGVSQLHLIESDARKCAFLREAARITGTPATIHNRRIEAVPAFPAATVTARALAPLAKLLDYTAPFLGSGGIALFLKGKTWDAELTEAGRTWRMAARGHESLSDDSGMILRIEDLHRGP
jgi:16S rRNA (guanine527-N7)-methyltransferase